MYNHNRMTKKINFPIFIMVTIFSLFLGGLLLTAPTSIYAAPPAQDPPPTPPSVAGGQLLWSENCLPCHGPIGKGDGPTAQSIPDPFPDFSNPQTARQYVPAANFDVIKNGRMDKMMPPWDQRLNDAQMWDAAAYVWRLGTSPQNIAAGEAIFTENCTACHGQSGAGDGPEAPAEIPDFTNVAAMVQKSQVDLFDGFMGNEDHAQFSGLSEAELWQAFDYVRAFSFEVTLPKSDGILTGQVINASTNQPVGDVEVTLHVFQDNAEIDAITTLADSNGNYRFENLSTEHSVLYMVEGLYQDFAYVTDNPGIFTPDTTETTLNLNVYDSTDSDANISITQMHYLVSFSPDTINAVQVFVIGNSGDQTYVGKNGQTFSFALPPEAANVAFQNDPGGERFVETENGYVDTIPIRPGRESSSVVALYDISFDDDELTVDIPLPLETQGLNILLSNQGAALSSDQVEFGGNQDIQGNEFAVYNGSGLAKGEMLTLKFSDLNDLEFGMPAAMPGNTTVAPAVDQNLLMWIIVGAMIVVVAVVGVGYPLMRSQVVQTEMYDEDPAVHQGKLVLMLARLDELFEAGKLDGAVYRQARARYKTELARLLRG